MANCKECVHKCYTEPTEEACNFFIDSKELRPKGRWEMRGGKLYCTHCGKRAAVARDSEDFWYTKGTPACPNCGAKMEVT